ncbi:hypothetical protein [Peribacillus kribbensis]|uniref:hypothetical protein n=1 Tax=Peribacillus kribbensis TaxID=356658 RepID=UPI000429CEE0|nr:hypothetical protein [Peribacillus kribbensis]
MFDPTAFENMKVVLEGIVYDKDLEGGILVTDRSDLVDLAVLTRTFSIELKKKSLIEDPGDVICRIYLAANLGNLAAELLNEGEGSGRAGCQLEASYRFNIDKAEESYITSLFHTLRNLWGENREVEIKESRLYKDPSAEDRQIEARVIFGRLVTEAQISDFNGLIEHLIYSIDVIRGLYK